MLKNIGYIQSVMLQKVSKFITTKVSKRQTEKVKNI